MPRVAELLAEGVRLAGDEARRESEVLLCAALGKPRSYLFAWPDAQVDEAGAAQFRSWLEDRVRGVPLAYILGQREFWSLPLTVSDATLVPRPDTELLVERALALDLPADVAVLDLGTGSGAIALALASERPGWRLTGVDSSAKALAVAAANGQRLALDTLRWLHGSWFESLGVAERFALIVSNPPYLAGDDPHLDAGDLRFEPREALVSGTDGLDAIRHIIEQAPRHLEPQGWLLLEHGFEQAASVRKQLSAGGFCGVQSYRDLAGHERVTAGRLPPQTA